MIFHSTRQAAAFNRSKPTPPANDALIQTQSACRQVLLSVKVATTVERGRGAVVEGVRVHIL